MLGFCCQRPRCPASRPRSLDANQSRNARRAKKTNPKRSSNRFFRISTPDLINKGRDGHLVMCAGPSPCPASPRHGPAGSRQPRALGKRHRLRTAEGRRLRARCELVAQPSSSAHNPIQRREGGLGGGQQVHAQTAGGAVATRCDACRKPLVWERTRSYRARASSSSSAPIPSSAERVDWESGQQVQAQTAGGAVATRCDACRKLLLPSLATPPAARAPPVCLCQIPLHAD